MKVAGRLGRAERDPFKGHLEGKEEGPPTDRGRSHPGSGTGHQGRQGGSIEDRPEGSTRNSRESRRPRGAQNPIQVDCGRVYPVNSLSPCRSPHAVDTCHRSATRARVGSRCTIRRATTELDCPEQFPLQLPPHSPHRALIQGLPAREPIRVNCLLRGDLGGHYLKDSALEDVGGGLRSG
jgi:hypothetical protein